MIGLSVLAGGFIMFSLLPDSAQRPEVKEIKRHRYTLGCGKLGCYSFMEKKKLYSLQSI